MLESSVLAVPIEVPLHIVDVALIIHQVVFLLPLYLDSSHQFFILHIHTLLLPFVLSLSYTKGSDELILRFIHLLLLLIRY